VGKNTLLALDEALIYGWKNKCNLVTSEMLKAVFSSAAVEDLKIAAAEINYSISIGKLDTHNRMSHFLGQCRHEGAKQISISEDLTYSTNYKSNPKIADKHGYTDKNNKGAADQVSIANNAYANRIGNGDASSGDGWKFSGRGIKQLTGRANYRAFTKSHETLWNEGVDFEESPDLLVTEVKYAIRSAVSFWVDNKLYLLADSGLTKSVSNQISAKINPGEQPPHTDRYSFTKQIYDSNKFKNTCFNKTSTNSNSKAKKPL